MTESDDLDCDNLNTTECVLKYIKSIAQYQESQHKEFNWDPISVYITAVIGGIALWLAILTIGQAVLSAAHGRLKSSQYAIGPWHKMSSSYVSGSEMRLRAVAYTPIISISQFIQMHDRDKTNKLHDGNLKDNLTGRYDFSWLGFCLISCVAFYLKCVKPIKYCIGYMRHCKEWMRYLVKWTSYIRNSLEGGRDIDMPWPPDLSVTWRGEKDLDEYFPAQWLCLLTCLRLDYPEFWPDRPLGLDYIPGDLTAAPAWGPIKDLCTFVLLAAYGRNSPITVAFDKDPKLPRIYSDWFDFHFEKHPQLGYLAVFHILKRSSQTALFDDFHREEDIRERIRSRLTEAHGSMDLVMGPDRTIDFTDKAATDSEMAYVPWAINRHKRINRELGNILDNCPTLDNVHGSPQVPGCEFISLDLITAVGCGAHSQPFEILFGRPKKEPPDVFPCKRYQFWNQMKTLLLLNHRWFTDSPNSENSPRRGLQWASQHPGFRSWAIGRRLKPLSLAWSGTIREVMKGLDEAFAANPEETSQSESVSLLDKRKQKVLNYPVWNPYSAAKDVAVIDEWIQTHAPRVTICRKATLAVLATAVRNLILNNPPELAIQPGGGDGGDGLSARYTMNSLQQDIMHGKGILKALSQEHYSENLSKVSEKYKIALLSQIQDSELPEESRMAHAESLANKGHDKFVQAILEVERQWNDEWSAEQDDERNGEHGSTYKYIGQMVDYLIITRSILVGLIYLSAENDSSWILDGDEDWNQVVSFL